MKKIGIILSFLLAFNVYAESCEKVKVELTVKENKEEKSFVDIDMCDLSKDKVYTANMTYDYSEITESESFLNVEVDLTKNILMLKTDNNNGEFLGLAKKEFNKTIVLKNKNEVYEIKLIK